MTKWDLSTSLPEDFDGIVRLFPLPNLVMFPHVLQPLHIFEPRYCDMLEEALQTDRLITMALLKSGWEMQYGKRPALESAVCIGQVIAHTPTDDDRHNILLVGLRRAKIIEEVDNTELAFRQAHVEIIEDLYPVCGSADRPILQRRLLEAFQRVIPSGELPHEGLQQLLSSQIPLGTLTDVIAFSTALPQQIKQQLLGEADVDRRCRLLLQCLLQISGKPESEDEQDGTSSHSGPQFPPPFSEN